MLKFGYITELDLNSGMVRVNFTEDGIVSNPLPVSVPASKEDKYSFPFVINEHVWCLMDENCEFGVVGGAIYSVKDKPPAGSDEQTIVVNIGTGKLQLKIDRQMGGLKIITLGEVDIQALKVSITSPAVEVNGSLAVAGALTAGSFGGTAGVPMEAPNGINATGDVKSGTVSLASHVHTGAGAGNPTSAPLP